MTTTQTIRSRLVVAPEKPRHVRPDGEPEGTEYTTSQAGTRRHPFGVKPSGNVLTSDQNLALSMGQLGQIPDSMLMLLLEFLNGPSLIRLGSTCKGLYAFCAYDQLWRDLSIREELTDLTWRGSWRASWRRLRSIVTPDIDCSHLFSDALYRPFQCSQISFEPYLERIPGRNLITRIPDLSPEEFNQNWTNRPFILTEPVAKWRVYRQWSESYLLKTFGETSFRAEAVDWSYSTYNKYMHETSDESPLYLFDSNFVEKMNLEIGKNGAYEPPRCFGEDLFTLLGEQRPDHRWLIVGPERSGSTFHKDPNATSAWNAVIRGSKYWIMFENATIPPGVFMSEDQSEVTSPLSIAEWLLTFHDEARNTPGCLEGICREGEVLHVPSGWWHLVVNLEPAIALTQNFVPKSHLGAAINFLKNKADQVSGFKDNIKDPYMLFQSKLSEAYPELAASFNASCERKRKWDDIVADGTDDEGKRGGFSFGFGIDDDLDEVP